MSVLLIGGSPSATSRSAALLEAVGLRLQARGLAVEQFAVRELSAVALLHADASHPSVQHAADRVERAEALVVATPVYKAAYSGVLKAFLDLLPQTAFKGKSVLPLATAGSPHHMLALDYALRPVLQALGARHVLAGVYATDAQVTLLPEGGFSLAQDLAQRLDDATEVLTTDGLRLAPPSAALNSLVATRPSVAERCSA